MTTPSAILLDIRTIPDPCLSIPTKDIGEINGETVSLVARMGEVMYRLGGVGLAANQVGISQRIFVYEMNDKVLRAVINPRIVGWSGAQVGHEGCLSIPGKGFNITRHETVHLLGLDLKGNVVEKEATGIEACIFQHEIDHLDGRTILDHLPKKERIKAHL